MSILDTIAGMKKSLGNKGAAARHLKSEKRHKEMALRAMKESGRSMKYSPGYGHGIDEGKKKGIKNYRSNMVVHLKAKDTK